MPKVKPKRNLPTIDMTAMVDVAFLLLTFFILTTKFRPEEKVVVDTPSSVSEIPFPGDHMMIITVDNDGRVFIGFNNVETSGTVIDLLAAQNPELFPQGISEAGRKYFALQNSVGVPFNQLSNWLNSSPEDMKDFPHTGIDAKKREGDAKNELQKWILYARNADPEIRYAVKGDQDAPYPAVAEVISSLQGWNINKMNLVTTLEAPPAPEE